MPVHLLGQHNVIKYHRLRMWPERGMIRIEHMDTGAYVSVALREMLERIQGLSEMVGRTLSDGMTDYYDELCREQAGIDAMVAVCQLAKEQGDPMDDRAVRDKARDGGPCSVVVPSGRYLFVE